MRRRLCWLTFMGVLSLGVPWLGAVLYPWPYLGSFVQAAQSQHMSPYLLAAVARVESRFDPLAVSATGAVGVMQVEPTTASYLAHWPAPAADVHLRTPQESVAIGARYLRILQQEFGAVDAALAAYNGGDATVRAWIRSGTWRQGRPISDIPYPETRLFVEKVLRDMRIYAYVYPGLGGGGF